MQIVKTEGKSWGGEFLVQNRLIGEKGEKKTNREAVAFLKGEKRKTVNILGEN